MTPTYENEFILSKYELYITPVMQLHKVAAKTLKIPTIKRNMPIFKIYFVTIFECL